MNETQLLRQQCELESRQIREIAALCAGAATSASISDVFSIACATYLEYVGERCEARDADHEARLRAAGADHERLDLERLGTQLRARRDALSALAAASPHRAEPLSPPTHEALRRYCELLAQSREDSTALMTAAARRYSVEDWRAVARVDADSIREERRLRTEVLRLSDERGTARGP
jgi:hypothetical protein